MTTLIGYASVSTRQRPTDRQLADLVATGVRPDDLNIDRGVSGARASARSSIALSPRSSRATRS